MLNRIVIMGRLTRDPELRRTGNGTAVAALTLAVDRDYKSQSGEKETDFIDVVTWRSTAEFVSKYFTKGRMAVVEGRLQIRDWTDKDGGRRRSAEVVADKKKLCVISDMVTSVTTNKYGWTIKTKSKFLPIKEADGNKIARISQYPYALADYYVGPREAAEAALRDQNGGTV